MQQQLGNGRARSNCFLTNSFLVVDRSFTFKSQNLGVVRLLVLSCQLMVITLKSTSQLCIADTQLLLSYISFAFRSGPCCPKPFKHQVITMHNLSLQIKVSHAQNTKDQAGCFSRGIYAEYSQLLVIVSLVLSQRPDYLRASLSPTMIHAAGRICFVSTAGSLWLGFIQEQSRNTAKAICV